jgi:alpha-glucosidase (family GH31 glycosyl hydrolase)
VRRVYLPAGPEGWVDFHTGRRHEAGAHADVEAPLGRPPLFVRVGAALLLAARDVPRVRPHDAPARTLYAVPGSADGSGGSPHFEDDGESWSLANGDHFAGDVRIGWSARELRVSVVRRTGTRGISAADLSVELPSAGSRRVVSD